MRVIAPGLLRQLFLFFLLTLVPATLVAAPLLYRHWTKPPEQRSKHYMAGVRLGMRASDEMLFFQRAMNMQDFVPITRAAAEAQNAARPDDLANIAKAKPLIIPFNPASANRSYDAVRCMTQAIYYEAANEPDQGQRAVAQVVLNRVRHPAYPDSVCGVVYQGWQRSTGCQFSFTCDGSLARLPSTSGWIRARRVAMASLTGWVEPSVGTATHYHANYVVPYWASSLDKVATIGAHIFYNMRGAWGRPAAFSNRYAASHEFVPNLAQGAAAAGVEIPAVDPGTLPIDPAVPGPLINRVSEDSLGQPVSAGATPGLAGHRNTPGSGPSPAATVTTTRGASANKPSAQAPRPGEPAPQADRNHGVLTADERAGSLRGE